jgi:dienelactone hydrolase
MRSQSAHRHVAGLGWVFVFVAALLSAPAAAPDEFQKGKVIEKVVCRDFADQSYALYLPSDFVPTVKRPILYLFDPGARGPVAVERFLQAAEKYGWILVASNNSRNGPWEANLKAAQAMFADSIARLPVDETRIYAGGFSGGSRAACVFPRIIMRRVAGIIGVGAGISNTGTKPEDIGASSYFGIIGLADFNYPEMKRLDADLDGAKVPHRVLYYEAPHQWPDPETCGRAVGWMEITAMKQGKRSRNEGLIDEMLGKELENASALKASGKVFWAARQYEAVSQLFDGLRDSGAAAEAGRIQRTREFAQFLKEEKKRDEKDVSIRRDFVRAYTLIEQTPSDRMRFVEVLKDLKLGFLKKEAKAAGTVEDRSFAYRILFDISVNMEQKAFESYDQKDWPRASSLFELAAEACPDGDRRERNIYFNMACVAALRGDAKAALKHLETAVAKGFSDVGALEDQEDLERIRKTAKFRELVERVKKIQ